MQVVVMAGEPVSDFYNLVDEIAQAASVHTLVVLLTDAHGRFAGERCAYLERLASKRAAALRAAEQPAVSLRLAG